MMKVVDKVYDHITHEWKTFDEIVSSSGLAEDYVQTTLDFLVNYGTVIRRTRHKHGLFIQYKRT